MSIVQCVRFSVAVLVALAASSVLTVASASAQVTWKLASAYPADNFHTQNLAAFANDVAQMTDGRLGVALKTGLQEIGDRLTKEWLMRAGADGLAIIDAYRRLTM
jgi:TRAP-type C4-dicarboxylate transport system substrate-binding protein